MKKLILISFLTVTMQCALQAQQGLSDEGYKHWIKAITLMENIQEEVDYLDVVVEFGNVLKTDSTYAEVYYNLGALYTKIGELGGGIPMFDAAKGCYDKYLELRPSDRAEIIKEQAKLEVKREIFIKKVRIDMVLIEGGEIKDGKNIIKVEPFYVQRYMFSFADWKRLITPMANIISKELCESYITRTDWTSPTENDDRPVWGLSFNTVVAIVKIINCITGRNYFIPTKNHFELMKKNTNLRFGGRYLDENAQYSYVREWVDFRYSKSYHLTYRNNYLPLEPNKFYRKDELLSFRLALPVSDISKQ